VRSRIRASGLRSFSGPRKLHMESVRIGNRTFKVTALTASEFAELVKLRREFETSVPSLETAAKALMGQAELIFKSLNRAEPTITLQDVSELSLQDRVTILFAIGAATAKARQQSSRLN
jgi:nitrogen-specific signal transduction histidine kinase